MAVTFVPLKAILMGLVQDVVHFNGLRHVYCLVLILVSLKGHKSDINPQS